MFLIENGDDEIKKRTARQLKKQQKKNTRYLHINMPLNSTKRAIRFNI